MPPKRKMPGKLLAPLQLTNSIQQSSDNSSNSQKTISGLDPEAEDQFELELCWCIQQLETCLNSNKLQEKQVYNTKKTLNILKSNSASLIKKRHIMRNTFGDYRSKMIEEEKKFSKTVIQLTPAKPNNKFIFLKKANSLQTCNNSEVSSECIQTVNHINSVKKTIFNVSSLDKPFKFNFKQCN